MKELLIEEKARRYDEAIKKFDVILNLNTVKESGTIFADDVRKIFHELAESEEEKIRKALIKLVKKAGEGYENVSEGVSIQKAISWLEKQGEHANFLSKIQVGDKVTRNKDGVLVNLSQLNRIAKPADKIEPSFDEAQGTPIIKQEEHKPTDKDESKFKVGDWVVCESAPRYTAFKIGDVVQISNKETLKIFLMFKDCFRPWTIQDAKDGDVISFNDGHGNYSIELIKSIADNKIEFWFCLTNSNRYEVFDGITPYTNLVSRKDATPATKEQRDALMKAMADAGYTFDFDKKELRKIENEIEIPFGAKNSELQEAIYYIPKGFHAEIDDDKVVIKKGEKPAAWSKEDEIIIYNIEQFLHLVKNNPQVRNDLHKEAENWLESLKDRVQPKSQWKPSDLPRWKKGTLPNDNTTGFNSDYFCYKGYNINYKELFEKLPKDD